jgi:hypothetical protein
MIDLYDHEEKACREIELEMSKYIGTSRNVEGFLQEMIHRLEKIGLVAEPRTFWDERNKCYWNEFEIVSRCAPEPFGFDFDRQSWEVRHDVAGIEPDKVGVKPMPFDGDLVHADDPAKFLAKTLEVPVSSMRHGHDSGGHTHTHDGTTHSH